MNGMGSRLRARGRVLGLSDAEIARRVGLSPSRYTNYVNDVREPDFVTLLRICQVLQTTPNDILEAGDQTSFLPSPDTLRQRIAATVSVMDEHTLRLAVEILDALNARSTRRRPDSVE